MNSFTPEPLDGHDPIVLELDSAYGRPLVVGEVEWTMQLRICPSGSCGATNERDARIVAGQAESLHDFG
jgi:hypothetical protein